MAPLAAFVEVGLAQDDPLDALRAPGRERKRDCAAQAVAEQHEGLGPQRFREFFEVCGVVVGSIAKVLRPVAEARAQQVHKNASAACQRRLCRRLRVVKRARAPRARG